MCGCGYQGRADGYVAAAPTPSTCRPAPSAAIAGQSPSRSTLSPPSPRLHGPALRCAALAPCSWRDILFARGARRQWRPAAPRLVPVAKCGWSVARLRPWPSPVVVHRIQGLPVPRRLRTVTRQEGLCCVWRFPGGRPRASELQWYCRVHHI